MRIVFAGTPDFAARSLAALIDAAPKMGWSIPLVLTQPDRPAGRGMRLTPSPVKQLALAHGLSVDTPHSLRKGDEAAAAQRRLREAQPDVLIVAAYGLILPPEVLDIPRGLRNDWTRRLTAVNVHASLLPRWRGAAPVARAIEAGDASTGVTIMQMEAGLDTGPMLLAEPVSIAADESTGQLTERLAVLGAGLLVRALRDVATLNARPQPAEGVTYAHKVDKAEAWVDWTQPAEVLARKVRAYDPFPVAQTRLGESAIRIWRATPVALATAAEPGTITAATAAGVDVACGQGSLRLLELQRAGGKRLAVRDFLAGYPLAPFQRFDSGPPHA
ncbi:MAG TPA: methionyl-tRNA formyltransferase [Burkholderiaceae bacterium]|nr:methionyl-tRNA formyltransferase [Burkholderiaceae bacterium]